MGTEPRLRTGHPDGLVVGDIGGELEMSPSTLSHHLEKRALGAQVSGRVNRKTSV